jgi:hypothetical protein
MVITIYRDNSTGFGKVSIALLDRLGIANKISSKSFMNDNYAFLEEKTDLLIFCRALSANGKPFKFDERIAKYYGSKIKQYTRYSYECN